MQTQIPFGDDNQNGETRTTPRTKAKKARARAGYDVFGCKTDFSKQRQSWRLYAV
jgi:hypothetical protein